MLSSYSYYPTPSLSPANPPQVRECSLLLMFECRDDVLVERVLERGKTSGRVDDNEETMRKRLKNFHKETLPILEHYQDMGRVRKVCLEPAHGQSQEGMLLSESGRYSYCSSCLRYCVQGYGFCVQGTGF